MLAKLDEKHLTRCATVAVHWLLRRAAFKTNISQNKVAEKFQVAPEKTTPDTTEMDTMPPLEDIDNDNGAKKKFKFKKLIPKPHC